MSDLEDKTAPTFHDSPIRLLLPRAAYIETYYEVTGEAIIPDNPMTVIERVLNDHACRGNAGMFRVSRGSFQDGSPIYYAMPTGVRNSRGAWTNVMPALDVLISFPVEDCNGLETLQVLRHSITQAAGIKVEVGTNPGNMMYRHHSIQGANNERASGLYR